MSGKTTYTAIIEAKDGSPIPLCRNGSGQEISLHSKYNPLREADGFCSSIDASCLFFVVLGLAGGYHIEKLRQKCPAAKILVVESSDEAVSFLRKIPAVKKILSDRQVSVTDAAHLEEELLDRYKPALHGNLTILQLRQWESLFMEEAEQCRKAIQKAIQFLAADFSVQSHFGKIWQKNILSNLSLAEKTESFRAVKAALETQLKKTAAIIAAGPSLDESLPELKANREQYFVIATDTAFSALIKQGVRCDAVVSIDGQMISHQHYMEGLPKDTLFVFDLCASSSAVRKTLEKSGKVLLAETGHPLSQYASLFTGSRTFIHLEAGSGTVTIAAASFARAIGFSGIAFFGADFSYSKGKPYCRGTYLENQFHAKSTRLTPAEESYSALMYRTPLIHLPEGRSTTEILEAYKKSLEVFMEAQYDQASPGYTSEKFDFKAFKTQYCKDLRSAFKSENEINEASYAFTTLLPLCAKLGKGSAFLAYLKTLSYTETV